MTKRTAIALVLASVLPVMLSLGCAFGVGRFQDNWAVSEWMRFAAWGFGLLPIFLMALAAIGYGYAQETSDRR